MSTGAETSDAASPSRPQHATGPLRPEAPRPPRAPRRVHPLSPLLVLSAVALVDQVDVGVARGLLPILEEYWNLADWQLGLIPAVFVFVNIIATIPAGWVADHYRRTRVIGWTLLSWSGLILLSATAVNYANMLLARALMGIGQAVDDPASTSLLGDYYPSRMRAKIFSFQQVSFFLGGAIGLGLGGFVGTHLGWRWAFVIVGVPGSLIAFLVFRLREPRRGEAELPEHMTWEEIRALPEAEPTHLTGAGTLRFGEFVRLAATELWAELKMVFGIRTMRYILVGVGALLFTVSGISTWLPIYHERFSGMDEVQATFFTAIVLGIGGLVGTLVGGWFSDRYHQRWKGGRLVIVVWSAVGTAICFMLSFAVQDVPLRLALQFLGLVAGAGAAPGLRAAMMDVVPPESRGVGASAMALVTAVFGLALAPVLVGALSDITGSLVTAFYIVFPPVIVGLLLLLRARNTLEEDAQRIVVAIYEENQLLETQRNEIAGQHEDD